MWCEIFIVYSALEIHFGWYLGRIPWCETSVHVQAWSRRVHDVGGRDAFQTFQNGSTSIYWPCTAPAGYILHQLPISTAERLAVTQDTWLWQLSANCISNNVFYSIRSEQIPRASSTLLISFPLSLVYLKHFNYSCSIWKLTSSIYFIYTFFF